MDTKQKSRILSVLIEKGITQKKLAEELGVCSQTVGEVIAGKCRSRRIERVLTELTGYQFPRPMRVPRYQDAV